VAARYLGHAGSPAVAAADAATDAVALLPPTPAVAGLIGGTARMRRPLRGLRRLGVLRRRGVGQAWWSSGAQRP
jgi:hypothetical protein